ncbi:MAG: 3-phosphoshikimate 1-carboxyvinyltransferase [Thermoleophilia bacterium]|nr:3-phosphoshikimate 1-carboxyvinyltransferase [Thermoleophilia bacterium]
MSNGSEPIRTQIHAGGGVFLPAEAGLRGHVGVPGDKSVSHRALLLSAVSNGPVHITGFLYAEDTLATLAAIRALGVQVDEAVDKLIVHGQGWEGLREPEDVINVANSGTLIRLLPGLVASCDFVCILTGDASIRRRPMARIINPLCAMGAQVIGRANNTLPPVVIRGGRLKGISHTLPIASAQVKSCLLLAGLRAEGETVIAEPGPSRDHTERLLRYAGVSIEREGDPHGPGVLRIQPTECLTLNRIAVPGDFSSAAFFLVGALLVPDSEVTVAGVGLNPTRTGLLNVLRRMGADIEVSVESGSGPEPTGTVVARTTRLMPTDITPEEVPLLIDELPLFMLAAAKASGRSSIRGAAELRTKESDRLAAMSALLRSIGIECVEHSDGMEIVGNSEGWEGGSVWSFGDHRIAMVAAIAGAASRSGVYVDDVGCVAVSYPEFVDTLGRLGGRFLTAGKEGLGVDDDHSH